jgi:hypothetical protein
MIPDEIYVQQDSTSGAGKDHSSLESRTPFIQMQDEGRLVVPPAFVLPAPESGTTALCNRADGRGWQHLVWRDNVRSRPSYDCPVGIEARPARQSLRGRIGEEEFAAWPAASHLPATHWTGRAQLLGFALSLGRIIRSANQESIPVAGEVLHGRFPRLIDPLALDDLPQGDCQDLQVKPE